MAETGLILLAAGNSSRMGAPKQLLDLGGKPLIRRAAETALASTCRPVVVVLGSCAERIRPALDGLPLEVVVNSRWGEGIGTSISAGVEHARRLGVHGVILMLADQVGVTAATLERLLAARRETARPIIASRYAGTLGVPVYFGSAFFPQLLALPPDRGCKGVILAHGEHATEVDCPEAEADLDTPEDYERVRAGG